MEVVFAAIVVVFVFAIAIVVVLAHHDFVDGSASCCGGGCLHCCGLDGLRGPVDFGDC